MAERAQDNVVLDIRGQICPSCLLLALKELNRYGEAVRSGSLEIVVITDDRQATSTIPAAVDKMGYIAEVTYIPEGYRICLRGGV